MWQVARWVSLALELALLPSVVYLAVVALCAMRRAARLVAAPVTGGMSGAGPLTRFAIIIPAHDEAEVIGALLASVAALDYPRDLLATWVIADNCSDATSDVVEGSGVAHALTRSETARQGKGYALAWAFERLAEQTPAYDAYVVIDADSVAAPNLLRVFDRELCAGAAVIQASYTALNTVGTPPLALRWLALTLINYIRPLGRSVLGGSSTLTGNGMCFASALLERIPWQAFGLTEDYEQYLTLTLAGERVRFAPDAAVRALMPDTFAAMRAQDVRWESSGRGQSHLRWAARLLRTGIAQRDWPRIEAIFELLSPPLSQLVASVALVALVVVAVVALGGALTPLALTLLALALILALGVAVYIGSAFYTVRPPWGTYRALASAPAFVLWKLWVAVALKRRSTRAGVWVRTSR